MINDKTQKTIENAELKIATNRMIAIGCKITQQNWAQNKPRNKIDAKINFV